MDFNTQDASGLIDVIRTVAKQEIDANNENLEYSYFGIVSASHSDITFDVEIPSENSVYPNLYNKTGTTLSIGDAVIVHAKDNNFGNAYIAVKNGYTEPGGGGSGSGYTLPVASSSALGGVKSGTDITVDTSGNVSVNDNSHAHTIANVTGLQDDLNTKADLDANGKVLASQLPSITSNHNQLSGLQGGTTNEYYHLSSSQYTDLTDNGDSALHYHSSDRNRSNHTGTQLANTISDFDTEVSNNTDVSANTSARHTHSNKSSLDLVSGTNTGNETTTTTGTLINGATAKTTPVDNDMVGLMDSTSSNILKKLSWSNIKSTLKTYFDGLYSNITHTHTLSNISDVTATATELNYVDGVTSNIQTQLNGKLGSTDSVASATKLATARTINGVSFDGTSNITVYDSTKAPMVSSSATLPSVSGWYRVATSVLGIERCAGRFEIDWVFSGTHGQVTLNAGIMFGQDPTLNQGMYVHYGTFGMTKARIVYHTTYTGNYAYLEIYNTHTDAITVTVQGFSLLGWTLVTPSTAGSIPSGYTSVEMTFADGFSTEGIYKSTVATGTAPLQVDSTTLVTNLNADYLNGQHSSYYAPINSPTFTGTVTAPKILINRQDNSASGINWWKSSFTAWLDYMANSGSTGNGINGNITAPSGSIVTSYARRSFIENISGYGWTFESGTSSSTTPAVVAEISSVDGSAKFNGSVNADDGFVTNKFNITYNATENSLDFCYIG